MVSRFRPRSANDLKVFRGRSNLIVLAIEGSFHLKNPSCRRITRPVLAPPRAPSCALPRRVSETLMEAAKHQTCHLRGRTWHMLTYSSSFAPSGRCLPAGDRCHHCWQRRDLGGCRCCRPCPVGCLHHRLEVPLEAARYRCHDGFWQATKEHPLPNIVHRCLGGQALELQAKLRRSLVPDLLQFEERVDLLLQRGLVGLAEHFSELLVGVVSSRHLQEGGELPQCSHVKLREDVPILSTCIGDSPQVEVRICQDEPGVGFCPIEHRQLDRCAEHRHSVQLNRL